MERQIKHGFLLALATGLLFQGCETGTTVPVAGTAAPTQAPTNSASAAPASNRVEPNPATVAKGSTLQFKASLLDRYGKTVASSSITWSVTPSSLGTFGSTLNTKGLFTAQNTGSGTVTALYTQLSHKSTASASVTVSSPTASSPSPTIRPSGSPSPSTSPSPVTTPSPIATHAVVIDIDF